jgi:hypothetical protein
MYLYCKCKKDLCCNGFKGKCLPTGTVSVSKYTRIKLMWYLGFNEFLQKGLWLEVIRRSVILTR